METVLIFSSIVLMAGLSYLIHKKKNNGIVQSGSIALLGACLVYFTSMAVIDATMRYQFLLFAFLSAAFLVMRIKQTSPATEEA